MKPLPECAMLPSFIQLVKLGELPKDHGAKEPSKPPFGNKLGDVNPGGPGQAIAAKLTASTNGARASASTAMNRGPMRFSVGILRRIGEERKTRREIAQCKGSVGRKLRVAGRKKQRRPPTVSFL